MVDSSAICSKINIRFNLFRKPNFYHINLRNNLFCRIQIHLVPNDMKMLAFLGGELSNAASYSTAFANVNKKDCNDVTKSFSLDGSKSWKSFDY